MATIIQEIIKVFKQKDNAWLDYNEIYDSMDQSVFGPNKHGERGKRNIVYRMILGNPLFDIDENFRPKKFKLKREAFEEEDISETEKIYSTGETKIFIEGKEFTEVKFADEGDFEDEIKENHKMIFGEDSIYYDVKKKIGNRICDGIVFNPKNKKVYIIEAELFIHPLYGHIVPQIIDFFNAMKDEKTKYDLKWSEKVGWKESDKLSIIEAIDKENYDVIVIIDRITFEIKEAQKSISELIRNFVKKNSVNIIFKEFNVFVDENNNKIFRVK